MLKMVTRWGLGGLHFSRLPIALIQEVIAQKRKNLDYVTWGGGLALELLLAANAIRKMVFCFSSLDIFGLAPLFRKVLEEGSLEVEEWNALAMIQGFNAAEQLLPSMPFPLPAGSELVERSGFAPVYVDPITGHKMGAARALHLDVVVMHAQRADEAGNVEIQGARGLDKSAIGAAKKVLVTVEEIVPRGTFQADRRGLIIGRTFITAIAPAPRGAYPASCLPYYISDYRSLLEVTASTPLDLKPANEDRFKCWRKPPTFPLLKSRARCYSNSDKMLTSTQCRLLMNRWWSLWRIYTTTKASARRVQSRRWRLFRTCSPNAHMHPIW